MPCGCQNLPRGVGVGAGCRRRHVCRPRAQGAPQSLPALPLPQPFDDSPPDRRGAARDCWQQLGTRVLRARWAGLTWPSRSRPARSRAARIPVSAPRHRHGRAASLPTGPTPHLLERNPRRAFSDQRYRHLVDPSLGTHGLRGFWLRGCSGLPDMKRSPT